MTHTIHCDFTLPRKSLVRDLKEKIASHPDLKVSYENQRLWFEEKYTLLSNDLTLESCGLQDYSEIEAYDDAY